MKKLMFVITLMVGFGLSAAEIPSGFYRNYKDCITDYPCPTWGNFKKSISKDGVAKCIPAETGQSVLDIFCILQDAGPNKGLHQGQWNPQPL